LFVDCLIGEDLLDLSFLLHQQGINLRYLGLLLSHIKKPDAKNIILIEILIRGLKRQIKRQIRERMSILKVAMETPYLLIFFEYFHEVCNSNITAFVPLIKKYYNLPKHVIFDSVFRYKNGGLNGLLLLLQGLLKSFGIVLVPGILQKWICSPGLVKDVPYSAFRSFSQVIKHMHVIEHAQGYVLKRDGLQDLSIMNFMRALRSCPLNAVSLRSVIVFIPYPSSFLTYQFFRFLVFDTTSSFLLHRVRP
jgi:hypothetical protein